MTKRKSKKAEGPEKGIGLRGLLPVVSPEIEDLCRRGAEQRKAREEIRKAVDHFIAEILKKSPNAHQALVDVLEGARQRVVSDIDKARRARRCP